MRIAIQLCRASRGAKQTTLGKALAISVVAVLLAAGPWFKKNYVSHTNSSFPGLLKTIFRLLGLPPLNLFDAAASDLSDLFAARAGAAPYKLLDVDKRLFDPAAARESHSGVPGPRMDR